jgi:hypothetical protein
MHENASHDGEREEQKEKEKEGEDLSKYFKCRSCLRGFDSFGDMQRHIMIEHIQKGDIS